MERRDEEPWPKSERRGLVDLDLGGVAQNSSRRHSGGGGAHRSIKEMQDMSPFDKFITEDNAKADEPAKEGAMLDGGDVAQVRASTIQHGREEVYAALQDAASFHCLVEEWKDCEELEPKPKERWGICEQEQVKQGNIERSGVGQQTHVGV